MPASLYLLRLLSPYLRCCYHLAVSENTVSRATSFLCTTSPHQHPPPHRRKPTRIPPPPPPPLLPRPCANNNTLGKLAFPCSWSAQVRLSAVAKRLRRTGWLSAQEASRGKASSSSQGTSSKQSFLPGSVLSSALSHDLNSQEVFVKIVITEVRHSSLGCQTTRSPCIRFLLHQLVVPAFRVRLIRTTVVQLAIQFARKGSLWFKFSSGSKRVRAETLFCRGPRPRIPPCENRLSRPLVTSPPCRGPRLYQGHEAGDCRLTGLSVTNPLSRKGRPRPCFG